MSINLNLTTSYNAEIISAIANENTNSAKSNLSSVYDSADINIDAAVVSLSTSGKAKINAMINKSLMLSKQSQNPNVSAADRARAMNERRHLRAEINAIKMEGSSTSVTADIDTENADKMIAEAREDILRNAEESMMAQNVNRDNVLQLL